MTTIFGSAQMKLEISVFKEVRTAGTGKAKGFAGRELFVEALMGSRFVSRISGVDEELSAGSVPELIERIRERVGKIDRKGTPEVQFRFAPEEGNAGEPKAKNVPGTSLRKLEGDEISEFFRGMESIIGQASAGKK